MGQVVEAFQRGVGKLLGHERRHQGRWVGVGAHRHGHRAPLVEAMIRGSLMAEKPGLLR